MKTSSCAPAARARRLDDVKVLVVEDNRKLGSFLVRALQEEGYAVDLVTSGATALEQAASVPYDLVVLDWMLPELDGLSVCRALRARGSRTPILMLTARAEVSERVVALDAGADDYVSKPFALDELLARVRACLRRGGGGEGAHLLRVGPLVLDRLSRRVTIDGRSVELTARELALLAHLAANAGRVVHRTELLAKVWELSFDPGSNVIDVHVRNLRDKLGPHSAMIETVRGVGHRLDPSRAEAPARGA